MRSGATSRASSAAGSPLRSYLRLYARGGWWQLAGTWALGVSVGVLVRAAFVGHIAYDFWGVALAFTALFVLAGRLVASRLP